MRFRGGVLTPASHSLPPTPPPSSLRLRNYHVSTYNSYFTIILISSKVPSKLRQHTIRTSSMQSIMSGRDIPLSMKTNISSVIYIILPSHPISSFLRCLHPIEESRYSSPPTVHVSTHPCGFVHRHLIISLISLHFHYSTTYYSTLRHSSE